MIEPLTIFPGGCGMRRMSDSAVTDFPQPDSPTMPSVSPAATWNVTPSTARTTPSRVKNWVWRSVTRVSRPTSAESSLGLHPRVQCVAQPVPHERERKHYDRDADGRQKHGPRVRREERETLVDHLSPRRRRRDDAHAKERKGRLAEDRAGNGEGGRDDERRERVGQQMLGHDPARRRPDRAGRLDELAFFEGKHLPSGQPRDPDPADDRDGNEDQQQAVQELAERAVAERRDDDQQEEEVGERIDDVGEAHQTLIEPSAEEAGSHAHGDAKTKHDRRRYEADDHADPRRVDQPTHDVASEEVSAEQVTRIRVLGAGPQRLHLAGRVLRDVDRAVRRDEWRERRDKESGANDDEPGDRGLVPHEAVEGVPPQRALFAR